MPSRCPCAIVPNRAVVTLMGDVMWRKLMIAITATTLLSACALRTGSHAAGTDWTAVAALSADEQVEVITIDRRRVSGTLAAVDAERIVVGPVLVSLRRTDVAFVWTIPREDSLFNGYLVGAIVGLVFGGLIRAKGNEGLAIPASTAAVGSVVGAWIDRGWKGPPRKLVYRAVN